MGLGDWVGLLGGQDSLLEGVAVGEISMKRSSLPERSGGGTL